MQQEIIQYLKSKNVNVLTDDIENKLKVWRQWYEGKVDKFHNYQVYSGKRKLNLNRNTLNMASQVAKKWADLLLNEKVEINSDDEYTQEVLNKLLKQVNFRTRGNNLLELAYAIGGGFFIQYWDGKKTNQKYISQEFMYPVSYDSGRLTEVAFSSEVTLKNKKYIYLETHLLNDADEYVIDNILLENKTTGNNKTVTLVEADESIYKENNILPKIETHSKEPRFQMIRPNIANKENFNSPYGTSVYNGSTDLFKEIDLVFDSYAKEFLLGKKRIFVPDGVTMVNYDAEGNPVQVFDPNEEVFYRLTGDLEEGEIKESNMEIRTAQHDAGLQTLLNLLSQSVGLGSDTFKWDKGNVTTATQIISEQSDMFRTLKKHELLIEESIINMAKGLLLVEFENGDKAIKIDSEISVAFDDSIIEDKTAKRTQALLELNSGLISKIEYFRQIYELDDNTAIEFANQMNEEIQATTIIDGEEEGEGAGEGGFFTKKKEEPKKDPKKKDEKEPKKEEKPKEDK